MLSHGTDCVLAQLDVGGGNGMVDRDYFGGGCRIMRVVHEKLTVNAMEVIDGRKGIQPRGDRVGDKGNWFFEICLQDFGMSRYRSELNDLQTLLVNDSRCPIDETWGHFSIDSDGIPLLRFS